MRSALFVVSLLPVLAGNTAPASAARPDPVSKAQAPAAQGPARLAQRQPGGLPGMSEGEEEGRPGAKGVPGGLPGRSRQADPPLTRSLQTPKSPSHAPPQAGEKADKKAPRKQDKSPDGGN
jgi:hypothetical protein